MLHVFEWCYVPLQFFLFRGVFFIVYQIELSKPDLEMYVHQNVLTGKKTALI